MKNVVNKIIKLFKLSTPDFRSFSMLLLVTLGIGTFKYMHAEIELQLINNIHSLTSSSFIQFGIGLIVVLCIGGFSTYFSAVFSEKMTQHIQKRLQNKIRFAIQKGEYKKVEQTEYGKYNTLMISDTELIAGFFPKIIFPMISGSLQFSLGLYFAFKNCWELGFIILGISFCSLLLPKFFKPNLKEAQKKVQLTGEELRTFFSRSLERTGLIKVYNSKNIEKKGLTIVYDAYGDALIEQQRRISKMLGINNLITYGLIILQSFMELGFLMAGKLSLGAWMGLFQISDTINWPFSMMPVLIENLSLTEVAAERMAHFLHSLSPDSYSDIRYDTATPFIRGENISFAYDKEIVFKDFSFEINRNEILGLTWKSGEGKSTLIKMLAGLYNPQNGTLLKNKKDLNISYATQNELFFSDNIEHNIALSSNKEDNRMKTSLENASVDFLNPKQSLSLSTTLNKSGQPLSGGQQKRINLARAFYHDSDILILDEPTASLDSETKDRV
ncbi:MAG TPA: ABC transporter ATP-binding protein, partial [Thermotogota bacterium]|nr:ABC transporter ATP-binding protein [Thermotogota bacterium]